MRKYGEIAELYAEGLKEIYPKEEAQQLFLMTYSHLTHRKSVYFGLDRNQVVGEDKERGFIRILEELMTSRPLQHILGMADFYGMHLQVNEHTLIPRPETEELVDLIIKQHRQESTLSVIDIGTGSGCIAIALKKHLPQAEISAMDISTEAVQLARKNALNQEVDIAFMEADVLEWDVFMPEELQFDVVVSNPPYITPQEKEQMHRNVLLFEPHTALFVEEHAPLLFYDVIAQMAKKHLRPEGMLYFEINQYLGKETVDLLEKKGFVNVQLLQDINGVDRMVCASQYLR
ncbi:peptide chain release factor N(5)-glutamine methyltransferase [Sphingobacterium wenxiniae]|uniref:peptide chain release factor N(5)-glutamine methyltransferase n=1 Tax=Sphingobacterium wenxiniae TaxID=683125 RepID=A0A1I6QGM3_9SPHI|nr:peptide chain release factor N(5)-glutamine methyltransferase [Sphingobacterium wenxiniae]SFS51606.1 release factor glutamine methyltransferase [Sphingobacterium wenxiniae]